MVVALDTRGERCPLPVLRTEKALEALVDGEQLVVRATDPVARLDIALYCRQKGHACEIAEEGGVLAFTITKGMAESA